MPYLVLAKVFYNNPLFVKVPDVYLFQATFLFEIQEFDQHVE